jgi:hypothetical protein
VSVLVDDIERAEPAAIVGTVFDKVIEIAVLWPRQDVGFPSSAQPAAPGWPVGIYSPSRCPDVIHPLVVDPPGAAARRSCDSRNGNIARPIGAQAPQPRSGLLKHARRRAGLEVSPGRPQVSLSETFGSIVIVRPCYPYGQVSGPWDFKQRSASE